MKLSYSIISFLVGIFLTTNAMGQANASINILTQNSGMVNQGGTVFLQVDIGNTGPTSSIGVYKIRSQISIPTAIASVAASGHQLPSGWTITSQTAGVINLSNGTDIIPVNAVRTILINIQGNNIGGPSTVGGTLSFSNGNPPGTAPGTLAGDNTADNSSQSSIQVVDPTPVTLSRFDAGLINCQPILNWFTESEINSDRFEIERSMSSNLNWKLAGNVIARGFSSSQVKYSFTDQDQNLSSKKVFYRLKMIDKDGKYKYSDVLPVSVNCERLQLSAFPNPVKNGKLFISVNGIKETVQSSLVSMAGQIILKLNLKNGTNTADVSRIPDGTYILSATGTNSEEWRIKIIIGN